MMFLSPSLWLHRLPLLVLSLFKVRPVGVRASDIPLDDDLAEYTHDVSRPAQDMASLQAERPLAGLSVLIIVENLPVPFDRRVWLQAQTLYAAGARVSVICPATSDYPKGYVCLQGVHIYRHPLIDNASGVWGYIKEYMSALFWQCILSVRVYWRHRFHVIHGCNPPDLVFLIALVFRLFGVRYVFDHHDLSPELFEVKFKKRGLFWSLLLLCERASYALAHVALATNQSYQSIAIKRGKMRPRDVFIVRSAPDTQTLQICSPNDRWKNGQPFMISYLGVIGEQDGVDVLLHCLQVLIHEKQRFDVHCLVVGAGPALPSMRALAKELQIADYVTFTGRVSDADLCEILSTTDVCIDPVPLTHLSRSSTSNKILEYMAFAKPIVQFEMFEGRVSAGRAALYAAPDNTHDMADKIVNLLDKEEMRTRMGKIGYQRLHQCLSWQHSAPFLIDAYKRVIDRVLPASKRTKSET